jgi:hypothetical protein
MPNITEHHSKEEWEGDGSEHARIELLIPGHSIGIGDLLCDGCIAVGVKHGWGVTQRQLIQSWCWDHFVQVEGKSGKILHRDVDIRDGELISHL